MSDNHDDAAGDPTQGPPERPLMTSNAGPLGIEKRPMESWEEAARFFYSLLDDIDTADDIAKSNDDFYRKRVRHIHNRRFEVATTDGYSVKFFLTDDQT